MDKTTKQEFIEMLKEARGTPQEWAVIMEMVDMLEDDEEFEHLAKVHKGIAEYDGQFFKEKEAYEIVDAFENYDGSRGPKWQPQVLFSAVEGLGGKRAEPGKYNCWALYVQMNMKHSDEGGVLKNYAQGEEYAKLCYMLAVADLTDRDRKQTIREYFKLAH
jgi:hypothetical protein